MAAFPSYASIMRDGYGEQREPALLRSEMESGPARQAKVRSRVMVTRPIKVYLATNADYQAFITWFRDTINEGADWFDWTDPVDGVTKSVRFVGGGLSGSPLSAASGGWFVTGLQIEGWGV